MTMDNDPRHFNPNLPRKSYNPFECDNEALDTLGMESENVYSKEDHIGFDLKEFEESAKSLTFLMDNDDSLWEESIASANDHTSSFEKDVTECELPEPIISKDIGVDEGAHTLESKDSSNFQVLSGKGDDAMGEEEVSHESDVLEAPKTKLSGDLLKDSALYPYENPCVDGLNRDVQSGLDGLVEDESYRSTDQKLDLANRASFPVDWATMNNSSKQSKPDSVGKNGADHEDTLVKKGKDNSPNKAESILVQEPAIGETQQQNKVNPDETQNEEQTLPNSDNNMIFGFNSSSPHSDPINEDNPQSADPAKTPVTPQTTTRHEQPTSINSVSTGVPHFPSSITFSGPVVYSGNASIRSESSTGSTHSFAFPVLQNEWNSSPVRMVKADRRRKKHRRWMQSLVCCRF